jgi:phosphoglycolate phosphatase
MIKLIVFDLDGTLIDSLSDLTDAVNHTRTSFNMSLLTEHEVKECIGEGAKRLIELALPGLSEARLQEALQSFLNYSSQHIVEKTELFPDVIATLSTLKEKGYILTVASNKNEPHCKEILRLLNANHYFDAILGAESAAERKPSPAPILHLMKQFALSASETIMIGDSINDILAGKRAGVMTIGCEFGYGKHNELCDADHTISDFQQIPPLIFKLL